MSNPLDDPLGPQITKDLKEWIYEKRKLAALRVESLIKDLVVQDDYQRIVHILEYLHYDFILSILSNSRKGGLIAIAAIAIGLNKNCDPYISYLVTPVIKCFFDSDIKVRFYACESLYNVIKIIRGKIAPYFNQVFDALLLLYADPDLSIRNAGSLLDALLKDIFTERSLLDLSKFMPLVSRHLGVSNLECRTLLISWLSALDLVPDIDLLPYYPDILHPLFQMLKDPSKELCDIVKTRLYDMLTEANQHPSTLNFPAVFQILSIHCQVSKTTMKTTTHPIDQDDSNVLGIEIALTWILGFTEHAKQAVLQHAATILRAILPCISHINANIKERAYLINQTLKKIVITSGQEIEVDTIINVLEELLGNPVPTQLEILQWILSLDQLSNAAFSNHLENLFTQLITLIDHSNGDITKHTLAVLGVLSKSQIYVDQLILNIISLFQLNERLWAERANFIIQHILLNLSPKTVFKTFCKHLEQDNIHLEIAPKVVQTLNINLLTSSETFQLRQWLKEPNSVEGEELFSSLYVAWCHCPVSLLSLCLLAQKYELAYRLVQEFANLEITINFLVGIDKLIQLLESPVYLHLRLKLVEFMSYPYLFKVLAALLMMLPQSSSFQTLKNRLQVVESMPLNPIEKAIEYRHMTRSKSEALQANDSDYPSEIDRDAVEKNFESCLISFRKIQSLHNAYIINSMFSSKIMLSSIIMD